MDVTFKTAEGRFNYRACAVIISNNKLLVMHDCHSPYYYLPGGRVEMNETAENAVLRELEEELDINAQIIRPLWFNQSFFIEDVTKEKFHEICIYFLIDISKTDLAERGDQFFGVETDKKHIFEWLPIENIKNEYLYPLFIKDRINNPPENFEINVERKY